jgi:hypothetical protein
VTDRTVADVTTTVDPSTRPVDEDDEPGGFRWSVGSVLALVVVAAIIGFWAWAFSPWAPDTKADDLADDTFVPAANTICRTATERIDALPRAMDSPTPAERSAVVVQANGYVADMVAGLRAETAGASGRDRELLDQWFADWDVYLERRDAYAAELAVNEDGAVFTVPARNGGQITETMDGFARTNDLFDCLVPLDV